VDRLDRLTERLIGDLDRHAESPASACVELAVLGERAAGGLTSAAQARVDAHLDECLACLNAFIEVRDLLQGVAAPAPASAGLRRTLDELIGEASSPRVWRRVVDALRRPLVLRVPAWTAAAAAVAGLLLTWVTLQTVGRPGGTVDSPSVDRLAPANARTERTIAGVVGSVRDATSNGVDAHVVSVTDASGATYVLFAWGWPTVHAGESVEVVGIFTRADQSSGGPVYQGVATALRRTR